MRRIKQVPSLFVLLVALATRATADEVTLLSGNRLEGIARREPGRVVIETGLGTLTFPADQVKDIVPGPSAMEEYPLRLAALGEKPDANRLCALATWAREHGLIRYVDPLLERALRVDPDHAEAHGLRGDVYYKGRWMPRSERTEIDAVEAARPPAVRPHKPAAYGHTPPYRRLPEISPGYVYFGIPPGPPPRGSQNHSDYGSYAPIYRGLVMN